MSETTAIFGPYDAGGVMLHADPLSAYLDLAHFLDGEPQAVLVELRSADEARRYEAIKKVEAAGRQTFNLLPFDPQTGGGARLEHVLGVVRDFLVWTAALKKNGVAAPASPSPGSPEPFPCEMEFSPTSVFAP